MYRYLTINSWSAPTLAGLIVGMLLVQILTPTIVFGIDELSLETQTQTTDEPQLIAPVPPELDTSGAASDTSQDTDVIIVEESEQVDDQEGAAPEVYGYDHSGTTTIKTGEAIAGLTIDNEINFTEVNTETNDNNSVVGTTTKQNENTNSTLNDSPLPIANPSEDLPYLSVQATNTATTTNYATTSAETGDNSAGGNIVTINTGNAIAYTDVLNVVNTNIVNSAGLVKFVNETLGYQNFDLRDEFNLTYAKFETSQSTPSCTLDACTDTNTTINSENSAFIENNIIVNANTGGNEAVGNTTSIQTGNAYASANIINVSNTNITDSNYLLFVFNNFSDYAGDIILPNSTFFDRISKNSSGANNLNISTDNSATINNSVETIANSGDNQAIGDNSTIRTGSATAVNDTTNIVNQNIISDNSFSMLIRVHGNWNGRITGLPAGLTWRETDRGIEIVSLPSGGRNTGVSNIMQSTKNSAVINNNVQVFALTGDNKADGGDTEITTGNAYADSSILNIANTNVIGSNWSNLIFNIYGNWSGNLSFGQPNLWLGVTADSPDNPIMPGSKVTYTYTVFNRGDSTAPDVSLKSIHESSALAFTNTSEISTDGANTTNTWTLGDIAAGETRELSYTATVNKLLNGRVVSAIPLTSRVDSSQRDADNSDNEEIVTIYAGEKRTSSNSKSSTFRANFDIKKTASRDLAQPGDTVDYTVTFFNRGGQLYDALLVDMLENEAGEIINQQSWPLGEIKNWETITISYSMKFDSAMATGTYTNSAQLIGFHESRKARYQTPYESPITTHKLSLGIIPTGQVLGISDSVCQPYLTEYMRYGVTNNQTEVIKLQQFLSEHLNLNLSVTGIFNQATEQGVRNFQKLYRDEILTPWGLTRDSGYVYYTTQKKINEIMCGGQSVFPLASAQLQEINSFKNRIRGMSQFSLATENTRQQPTVPEGVSPVLTPTPAVRQPEKNTTVDTISAPSTPKSPSVYKPSGIWNNARAWWQSLTNRLRTTFR